MSEAARALQVGFYVFFPGGGIGRYTHELMSAMGQRAGVNVEVICAPEYKWAEADGYATWDGLANISHDIPTLRRLRFLQGQFVNPRRAIAHAASSGLDVLHLANINHLTFPYWRRALAETDLKVVASAHDVKRQKSILSRLWEDRQLQAFYRFADALFVHSEYQARELVHFAGVRREKVHVVPHGPYPHGQVEATPVDVREKWSLPQEKSIALFFGQIRDEKNLEALLRALRLVDSPLHLVVAGKAGGRHHGADYYKTIARRLGVASQTTFIPRFIRDDEVGELFTASDWVALPYDESFTSQSGVLNVAAHYDRPVLVSSSPVIHETVEACDIGVACDGDSPEALANGIRALHQRLRSGPPHDYESYRRRFSWDENAERTLDVYADIVHASGREGK